MSDDDRVGAVSSSEWAEAQYIGQSMRPKIREGARVSEVRGTATEQTRREAGAILGTDHPVDVLTEARQRIQAWDDAHS